MPKLKRHPANVENVLQVSHVSFAYDQRAVLTDVNLTIHRGDYLALVGSNGSGKTTLVKLILGLLKPTRGTITLFGEAQTQFNEWPRIGYVSQRATQFDTSFPVTVEQVVLMGRYARVGLLRHPSPEDRAKTRQALKQVELWPYRQRLIGDLSGGQQQRVFIARALASDPEVLFLDEPTVSVDERIKQEFYQLLKKLNEELHLTIILITHDIQTIAHEAMHIAYLDERLRFYDTVHEFFAAEPKARSV
ncbi:MAG: metal ABC transporter ATP-binding protein [Candidatus Andersenbacteria bacterium]